MKKYLIFICLEFFPLISWHSFLEVLRFSCLGIYIYVLHTILLYNYEVMTPAFFIASDTPTSSAWVELLVFNFCFRNDVYSVPLSMLVHNRILIFMVSWTLKDIYTHHWFTPDSFIYNIIGRNIVSSRCLMVLASLLLSSLSGLLTLVQWSDIDVWISDLLLFDTYRHCAVNVW